METTPPKPYRRHQQRVAVQLPADVGEIGKQLAASRKTTFVKLLTDMIRRATKRKKK